MHFYCQGDQMFLPTLPSEKQAMWATKPALVRTQMRLPLEGCWVNTEPGSSSKFPRESKEKPQLIPAWGWSLGR